MSMCSGLIYSIKLGYHSAVLSATTSGVALVIETKPGKT